MRRHVVLDANVIGVDPPLGKLEHRVLVDAHRRGQIVLVIPRLALREAVNTWNQRVRAQAEKIRSGEQELRKLVPCLSGPPRSSFDRDAASQRLLGELTAPLEAAGVEIPETPDISHADLIDRALHRRQPFDEKGSGYRDSLLWHIVRGYASDGAWVMLVSNDKGAFAEGRKQGAPLATQLAAETTGTVVLVDTLTTAIKELGVLQTDALDAARAVVQRLANFPKVLLDQLTEDLFGPGPPWLATKLGHNPFLLSRAHLGVSTRALAATVEEARWVANGHLETAVRLKVRQWVTLYFPVSLDVNILEGQHLAEANNDTIGIETEATIDHRCEVVLDPMTDRIVSAEPVEPIAGGP